MKTSVLVQRSKEVRSEPLLQIKKTLIETRIEEAKPLVMEKFSFGSGDLSKTTLHLAFFGLSGLSLKILDPQLLKTEAFH